MSQKKTKKRRVVTRAKTKKPKARNIKCKKVVSRAPKKPKPKRTTRSVSKPARATPKRVTRKQPQKPKRRVSSTKIRVSRRTSQHVAIWTRVNYPKKKRLTFDNAKQVLGDLVKKANKRLKVSKVSHQELWVKVSYKTPQGKKVFKEFAIGQKGKKGRSLDITLAWLNRYEEFLPNPAKYLQDPGASKVYIEGIAINKIVKG